MSGKTMSKASQRPSLAELTVNGSVGVQRFLNHTLTVYGTKAAMHRRSKTLKQTFNPKKGGDQAHEDRSSFQSTMKHAFSTYTKKRRPRGKLFATGLVRHHLPFAPFGNISHRRGDCPERSRGAWTAKEDREQHRRYLGNWPTIER